MKTMLAVLMMSCMVFAAPSPAEVQEDAEAVLIFYNRLFGHKASDALSSKPRDMRLIYVFGAGDFDTASGRPSVAIFVVGKTVFVAASQGKGVVVSPVCGRENIIKLADSLAKAPFLPDSKWIEEATDSQLDLLRRMISVPAYSESKLRVFQDMDGVVNVHLMITSKIGNLSKIDMYITPKAAEGMSAAIRRYIPLSGDILDVSELLVSVHAKSIKARNRAESLLKQGKYDDALEALHQALLAISETMKSIPGTQLGWVHGLVLIDMALVGMEKDDYPKTDPSDFEMAAATAVADALKQLDSPEFMADMKAKVAIAVKKAGAEGQAEAMWHTSIRLLLPQLSSKLIDLLLMDPPDIAEVARMRDSGEISPHELILIEGVLVGMQMDRFADEPWDWEAWAMTHIRNPSAD